MTPLTILIAVVAFVLGYVFARRTQLHPKTQFIEPKEVRRGITGNTSEFVIYPGNEQGAQFIEAVTPHERFEHAKNVSDMLTNN